MTSLRVKSVTGCIRVLPEHPAARLLLLHGYGQTGSELLPVAYRLGEEGFESWLPDLPGHGDNPEILSFESASQFVSEWFSRSEAAAVVGFSLGARLALATSARIAVAISAPYESGFDADARRELLSVLRPRWVREEGGPMQGLARAIANLPILLREHCLELQAHRDIAAVRSRPSEKIADCDHLSILLHPKTATRIAGWLRERLGADGS